MAWRNTTLGEVAPLSYGKALPEAKRAGGNVPVFGSNGIVGWHDSAIVNNPSVVIGRKGSVGALQFSEVPSWPIDTAFFTEGSSECDIRFLRYLFTTLPLQESSDSAVPGLNRDYAHSLSVRIPELPEQKAIAHALGMLDEKIRVNQQIVSTLEQIAQTIFKSWFVDFDPVHAKSLGEKPVGMDAETAALFPDSFEDSELGPIPTGWQKMHLGNLVE
jgi:type I restriction enzyme S subunit